MADISKITVPIDGTNTTYNLKDATARNSIPAAASSNPLMDGTVAVGSSAKYAREDHRHPVDTSRVAKSGDTMTGTLNLNANQYYDQNSVAALDARNSDIIGLGGIYTSDAAEDGREGINFYRDPTHWDSLFAKNGKLYFAPNRPKGSATGADGNLEFYARPMWDQNTSDISMRPMVASARANRLIFLPADQIIIEQTIDGGTTWTSANISDSTKLGLFSETRPGGVNLPRINGERNILCGLRVTFTGMKYNVPEGTPETEKYNYWNSTYVKASERYSNLREMWFWLGSNGDLLKCVVECATGANPNNWVTKFNLDVGLTGWSGSDWVRWTDAPTFGGGTNQTGNYWNWRVTFWSKVSPNGTFTQTSAQSIYSIAGYGDSVWGVSNPMMRHDHMYMWDNNQNVTFPARINATSFNGYTIASNVPANAKFTDTTYESKAAASGGTDVSLVTTGEKYIWNSKGSGTITGIKMNGASKGTSGVVDLGTVLTAHQDISGKADKSATVSTVTYDSTNKKLTKTINGTTSDIVTVATLKTALALAKGDIGLGNVENKSSSTIRGELTKANVTDALGYTPPTSDTNTHRPIQVNGTEVLGNNTTALNLIPGSNVSITNGTSGITIAATNTTYSSKAAASGGTDVSLVTTGEKYTWNNKTSNAGTVTKVSTGVGLTGGDVTVTGTIKAKLRSETALTIDSAAATTTSGRVYPVAVDKTGYLAVNVPWTDTNTHRPIQMNGTQILASNTTALNLKAGSNVTLSNSSGTVTIAATNTTYGLATLTSNGLMSSEHFGVVAAIKEMSASTSPSVTFTSAQIENLFTNFGIGNVATLEYETVT